MRVMLARQRPSATLDGRPDFDGTSDVGAVPDVPVARLAIPAAPSRGMDCRCSRCCRRCARRCSSPGGRFSRTRRVASWDRRYAPRSRLAPAVARTGGPARSPPPFVTAVHERGRPAESQEGAKRPTPTSAAESRAQRAPTSQREPASRAARSAGGGPLYWPHAPCRRRSIAFGWASAVVAVLATTFSFVGRAADRAARASRKRARRLRRRSSPDAMTKSSGLLAAHPSRRNAHRSARQSARRAR